MDIEEIREAMTNVTVIREDQAQLRARRSANHRDVMVSKMTLVRFLELLDGDVTVAEIRDALEGL